MGCSKKMATAEAGFSTVYIRVANQIETLVVVWSRGGFSIDITLKTLDIINITMWMGYFNSIIKLLYTISRLVIYIHFIICT